MMAENVEDGEIIDSDDETVSAQDSKISEGAVGGASKFGAYGGVVQRTDDKSSNYRSAPHQLNSSSEDDYSDEEDSFLWKRKKLRYHGAAVTSQPFINPLIERKNRHMSEGDTSDSCASPVKMPPLLNPHVIEHQEMNAPRPSAAEKPRRKRNNIWGSVMTEQTLSSTIGTFDVKKPNQELLETADDRNVENYDFTLRKLDTRPDPVSYEEDEEEMGDKESDVDEPNTQQLCDKETFGKDEDKKKEDRLKRKRKVKDRLGSKPDDNHVNVKERLGKVDIKSRLGEKIPIVVERSDDYIEVAEDDSVEKIVNALCKNLNEPKVDLMSNVVKVLGKKGSIDLLHETEMIEAQGGMMVNNNSRRRTPGGVFLQLLKFDLQLSKEQLSEIFGEDNRQTKQRIKERRALKAKRRNQGNVDFLAEVKDYKEMKKEIKEEETIDKILNNEKVEIDFKDSEKTKSSEMELDNLDEELGGAPDIELGEV